MFPRQEFQNYITVQSNRKSFAVGKPKIHNAFCSDEVIQMGPRLKREVLALFPPKISNILYLTSYA